VGISWRWSIRFMWNNLPIPTELVIDSEIPKEISRKAAKDVEIIIDDASFASFSRVRNGTLLVHYAPHTEHHFLAI
jgi:hypothetical protein